jgi:hypothetical protein
MSDLLSILMLVSASVGIATITVAIVWLCVALPQLYLLKFWS